MEKSLSLTNRRSTFLLVSITFMGLLTLAFFANDARADSMTLWLKAFIPNNGPAVIVPVPQHNGQAMIKGPGLIGCFLTDQRSFNADINSSARMTSILKFDLAASGTSNISQNHATGTTQKVACDSG